MTQTSRAGSPQKSGSPRVWRIGLYIRLSREDSHSYNESESISNQRAILHKHIGQFDDGDRYIPAREYVDDGISGTTDDERGSFQEMLQDIQMGVINCVMVKDLARSFRNYSDQGYYLDDWFPRHNVRFISLFHQPLDSYKEPRNMRSLAVPIQGVINENHCAETSEKVRAVFDLKRRKGQHIGSFSPFGYLKDPEDNNALIPDEKAAAVVREIYSMFLQGMSKNAMVRSLNDHGVLSPAAYKREELGLRYSNPGLSPTTRPLWTAASVTAILQNRMYCGDMVQGRFRKKSYKIHLQERVPEDEWFIVEQTHQPIISREVFDEVQKLLGKQTRTPPNQRKPYLFSGFLRCGDCGKSMARSRVGQRVYYFCRTYKDQSKTACTKHSIRHDVLEQAVLLALRQQVYLGVDCGSVVARINQAPRKDQGATLAHAVERRKKELAKIHRYQQACWQDWKDGALSQAQYHRMKEDYEGQARTLAGILEALQAEQEELEQRKETEEPLVTALVREQNVTALTRGLLIALVDGIRVYENGRITIGFRFGDNVAGGRREAAGQHMVTPQGFLTKEQLPVLPAQSAPRDPKAPLVTPAPPELWEQRVPPAPPAPLALLEPPAATPPKPPPLPMRRGEL